MVKDLESSDYIMIPKYDGTIDKPEIDVLKVLKSYDFSTYNNEIKIELTDDNKQVYLTTIFKHNNLKNQNEVTCCTKSTPINLKINIDNDLLDSSSYKLYSKIKKELKLFINPLEKYITEYDLSKITATKYKVRHNKKQ